MDNKKAAEISIINTELWRHTVVAFFMGYVLPVSLLLPKANWLEVETYSNGIVCGISESFYFYFYFDGKSLMEKLVKRLSETFLVIQLILIWSRVQTVFCAKRKGENNTKSGRKNLVRGCTPYCPSCTNLLENGDR